MILRRVLALSALLACAPAWAVESARIKVRPIAEAFPPLQYVDPTGTVRGSAYKLVTTALADVSAGLPVDVAPIEFVPLRRALQIAATDANVVLFSVARTPDREGQYQWLGTVSPYELWLYRHKDFRLPHVHDFSQLRGKGIRFGVQAGSNFQEWLMHEGVGAPPDNSIVDTVSSNSLNFEKAHVGRIDLFAHPEVSLAFRAAEHGMRASDFEKVLLIEPLSAPLWVVTGLRSDPRLVSALVQQLQRLRHSGQADRIRQESLRQFNAVYHLDSR